MLRAYLCLTDAQQCFFVAKVHLYIPALKISLYHLAGIQFRVRADKKAWRAIEQLRAFAQPVGQWRDDNQLQNLPRSGGKPHNILASLVAQLMIDAGMTERDGLPGFRFVGAELFGGGRGSAIA